MISASKILGKAKPAAGVNTTLLTVASGKQAEVTLFITNQGANPDQIRVALTRSGEVLSSPDYIAWDIPITAPGVFNATGIGLAQGDFVTIRSALGYCSFVATGLEVTI